ncbi:unnamed protein product [Sphagnum troendelagicum]|uniref:Transposase n=1 Tax=Sphagnum troendelagicum TaxID=128251 RepID=A0ABP0TGB8_9BRYO
MKPEQTSLRRDLLVDNVKRFIIIIKASVRLKGLKAKLMTTDAADEKDITRWTKSRWTVDRRHPFQQAVASNGCDISPDSSADCVLDGGS